jgi:2-C-methyl-D-erythritol 4-phosphate cytidylyltransferase
MKNIAVILAGGTGSRTGQSIPKQFFEIAGKTVIEHTIAAFECSPNIDEIAVVIHPAYFATIEKMRIANRWQRVKKILQGGSHRHESSLVAIDAYDGGGECNLLFHDAVRPLVSQRIISDVTEALVQYKAVDVLVPATDTIVKVSADGAFIQNIPNRNLLRRAQTPQGFRLSVIKRAYEIALQDPTFAASDNCSVVHTYLPYKKIYAVCGEESNMKLTYSEDVFLLEGLLK